MSALDLGNEGRHEWAAFALSLRDRLFVGPDEDGKHVRADSMSAPLPRRRATVNAERRRKPTRLRAYDYRTPALYHVVICTQHNTCRFGMVCEGVMRVNAIGSLIRYV